MVVLGQTDIHFKGGRGFLFLFALFCFCTILFILDSLQHLSDVCVCFMDLFELNQYTSVMFIEERTLFLNTQSQLFVRKASRGLMSRVFYIPTAHKSGIWLQIHIFFFLQPFI